MAHYVDGFVVPVPNDKLNEYKAIARKAAKIWKEHGALQVWETVADDVKPGKTTSFPQKLPSDGKRMFYGGFKTIAEA